MIKQTLSLFNFKIKLEIFDMMGRNVKTLFDGSKPAGRHYQTWNGSDNFGNAMGAGVYVYRMSTDNKFFIKKMILMK